MVVLKQMIQKFRLPQIHGSNIQPTRMICLITERVCERYYRERMITLHIIANSSANFQPNKTKICRFHNFLSGRLSTEYQKKRSYIRSVRII